MKPFLVVITLLMLSAPASPAQETKCTTRLADLPSTPELRGFRLGMSAEQVRTRLPRMRMRPADQFGFASVNIFPDSEPEIDKVAFEGVRTVTLEFTDGRVSSLWIGYDKTFKWQSLDEFAAGFAAALKLPDAWRPKFRTRLIGCSDFTVAVIPAGESPSIKLSDDAARELLEKRKAAKEEAQP